VPTSNERIEIYTRWEEPVQVKQAVNYPPMPEVVTPPCKGRDLYRKLKAKYKR
jgi:hypothetical protein